MSPESTPPTGQALSAGTRLEEFEVESVLGRGGFGITYLARDSSLERQVVIKENLPAMCAYREATSGTVQPQSEVGEDVDTYRWSMENFLREATTLASLDHPGIVPVLRKFEANGTAYFVMPYMEGLPLDELMKNRRERGEEIGDDELRRLLKHMLDALGYLHGKKIYHRDIKPGNILVTKEGVPILIDFGSARQRLSERSMTVVESAGYTPFEQLQSRGNVGPWSDLYSLGATMAKAITGEAPPKAADRILDDPWVALAKRAELRERYSGELLESIDRALDPQVSPRFQEAGEWLGALQGEQLASGEAEFFPPVPEAKPEPSSVEDPGDPARVAVSLGAVSSGPRRKGKGMLIALGAAALLAMVGVGVVLNDNTQEEEENLAVRGKASWDEVLEIRERFVKKKDEEEEVAREKAEEEAVVRKETESRVVPVEGTLVGLPIKGGIHGPPARTGNSIAISSDGNRIAVGSGSVWGRFNGKDVRKPGAVRVLELKDRDTWVQMGDVIEAEADPEHWGNILTMSADGSCLAVSAGREGVYVFGWSGTKWVKRGVSMQLSASSLSLSADGSRLAIGNEHYRPENVSGYYWGGVKIYEWSGRMWEQIVVLKGNQLEQYFGCSVSLSSDGSRLAVGARSGPNRPGFVAIFDLVPPVKKEVTSYSAKLVGAEVRGFRGGTKFGDSVSLSANGNRVAIGEPWLRLGPRQQGRIPAMIGRVAVYEYDEEEGWIQIGNNLVGGTWEVNRSLTAVVSDSAGVDRGSMWGKEVFLSADGNRVAVGLGGSYEDGRCAELRVFGLSGGDWTQIWRGNYPGSLAMSSNGKCLVFGDPSWGDRRGQVFVYRLEDRNAPVAEPKPEPQAPSASLGIGGKPVTKPGSGERYSWKVATIDGEGDVGAHTSLAFSPSGQPAISYHDWVKEDLKYASYDGRKWAVLTIDRGGVGAHTSLAFSPTTGQPAISYYDYASGELKYDLHDGEKWTAKTVDSERVGEYTSLAFSPAGQPAISYYGGSSQDLKYASYDGQKWTSQVIEMNAGFPQFISLAFSPIGHPAISYYDRSNKDLKCASFDGRKWTVEVIDREGDVGGYTSLAFSPAGHPAISYYDSTKEDLKYASYDGQKWTLQVIDREGSVGWSPSLAFSPTGHPAISYRDYTNTALKFASYDGQNWTTEVVDWEEVEKAGDQERDVGGYTSLAFSPTGHPAISYNDRFNEELKCARRVIVKKEEHDKVEAVITKALELVVPGEKVAPGFLTQVDREILLSAAEGGDPRAQYVWGKLHDSAVGLLNDDEEAVKWYRKAAAQDFAYAQINLGVAYETGHGVVKDEAEAVKWYRKAAEQGDARGQFGLGLMYETGRGVAKNEAEAVKLYRKAVEQGHAKGQSNLAYMYFNGLGVAKDEAEAVKLYRKAAEQGDVGAHNNLGVMYEHGLGVEKDEAEAVKWYRKAAEQGNAKAKAALRQLGVRE